MNRRAIGSRRGSILVIVVWMLLGASLIIFATQQESLAAQQVGYSRYQRAVTAWAARGGIYYSVAYMNSFAPQPALTLDIQPPPPFYKEHQSEVPIGWFVADRPYPTDDTQYGVRSEQARMPLSNLTTSAISVLFQDSAVADSYRNFVAKRRTKKVLGGGPEAIAEQVFRHPFELLALPGMRLEYLIGEDWNDNWVLDPHEKGHSPNVVTSDKIRLSDNGPDRGIIDVITPYTDGKLDPFAANPKVRAVFLGDWPADIQTFFDTADKRPQPQMARPDDTGWKNFALKSLTNTTSFFRVQCFGTLRGQPLTRVSAVIEYSQEQDATKNWYRIVDWRQDE